MDVPDDQHIYSNVEFSSGLLIKDVEEVEEAEESLMEEEVRESHRSPEDIRNTRRNARNCSPKNQLGRGILETNLDVSPEAPPASEGRHHHGVSLEVIVMVISITHYSFHQQQRSLHIVM